MFERIKMLVLSLKKDSKFQAWKSFFGDKNLNSLICLLIVQLIVLQESGIDFFEFEHYSMNKTFDKCVLKYFFWF